MKDIHEVLRRKQAKYAQLGKQIELLQQVAEKLREVAPLLNEDDDDEESAILADEPTPAPSKAAAAGAQGQASSVKAPARNISPRWP